MKLALLALAAVMASIGTAYTNADPLKLTDFMPFPGEERHYTGTFEGSSGTTTVRYSDGDWVVPGSVRAERLSENGDAVQVSYFVDGMTVRSEDFTEFGSAITDFSPAYGIVPATFSIGEVFSFDIPYHYYLMDFRIKGRLRIDGVVAGVEVITVGAGTFEAVRIEHEVDQREEFSGSWSRITGNETVWIARGVGTVKVKGLSNYNDSEGARESMGSNYELSAANTGLPCISPEQSSSWYAGPCFVNRPWIYFYNSRRWVYVLEDPWWSTMDGELKGRFSHGYLYGYRYLNFPWLTSYDGRVLHYLYGPVWGFDAASSLYWKFK
jgi:hypothetical protein